MTAPAKPPVPERPAGDCDAVRGRRGGPVRGGGAAARPPARSTASNLDIAAGRDRRAGRRVRLRQDDAGPDHARPGAADRGAGPVSRASRWTTRTGALKAYRRRRAAGAAGPDRCAEPAADGLRGGRRGPADPPVPGNEETLVADALSRWPGCGRRSGSSCATRTSSPAASGSASSSPARWRSSPRCIVADEPVSSLDASVRGEILALLLSLRDELGLSVLVVTHDLGLAWNIADRLAVMYLGRIVEVGTHRAGARRPAAPVHARRCCRCCPRPARRAGRPARASRRTRRRIPAGCRFHPRCPALADGAAAAAGRRRASAATAALPVLPPPSDGRSMAACLLRATSTPRAPMTRPCTSAACARRSARDGLGRQAVEVLPSRPVTVGACSRLLSTASSVASTTAAKNGSRARPRDRRRPVGAVAARRAQPGRRGEEDLAAAVVRGRAGPGQARARPAGPAAGRPRRVQRRVGQHDDDARAGRRRPGRTRPAAAGSSRPTGTPSMVSRSRSPKFVITSTPTVCAGPARPGTRCRCRP